MSSAWGNVFANAPNRNVYAVDTFADLRLITPPTNSASIEVDGGNVVGDGLGGIFFFSPGSIAVDDNLNIITPSTNPATGRWLRSTIVTTLGNVFRKNAIINGGMNIEQRGTNFPNMVANTYGLDRWKYTTTSSAFHTLSQDIDVPTVAQAGQLFLHSLRLNLTTPDNVIAAGDFCCLVQSIEGYNWLGLAQRICTFSFWVKATLPGIYCISLRNGGADRSITAEYNINIANTWEKKSIVFVASPSAGAWNYNTGIGVQVFFTLACGSNFQLAPGAWGIANAFATANQINGVQAGATDFRITGVQLEVGTIASEFERMTIQEELFLCMRYFEKSWAQGIPPLTAGSGAYEIWINQSNINNTDRFGAVYYRVSKRSTPVVVISPFTTPANTGRVSDGVGNDFAANSGNPVGVDVRRFFLQNNSGGALATGGAAIFHWTADCEL